MQPIAIINELKIGDKITAAYLNKLRAAVNAADQSLTTPTPKTRVFAEIARTTTTVTAGVEFEQIDTVTLKDASGDVFIFSFNNPLV
jgi:hypothetical protein